VNKREREKGALVWSVRAGAGTVDVTRSWRPSGKENGTDGPQTCMGVPVEWLFGLFWPIPVCPPMSNMVMATTVVGIGVCLAAAIGLGGCVGLHG